MFSSFFNYDKTNDTHKEELNNREEELNNREEMLNNVKKNLEKRIEEFDEMQIHFIKHNYTKSTECWCPLTPKICDDHKFVSSSNP